QLETNQRLIVRPPHSSPSPSTSPRTNPNPSPSTSLCPSPIPTQLRSITSSPRSSFASCVHNLHKIEQQQFTKKPLSLGIKNSKFKMTREHMANASFEEKFGLLLLGINDNDWRESLGSYYYW